MKHLERIRTSLEESPRVEERPAVLGSVRSAEIESLPPRPVVEKFEQPLVDQKPLQVRREPSISESLNLNPKQAVRVLKKGVRENHFLGKQKSIINEIMSRLR